MPDAGPAGAGSVDGMADELVQLYRKALAGRLEDLEGARSAPREEAVASIRRVAHVLRGSGGTFGFPEITRAAAALEDAADAELEDALQELLAVLRAVTPGGGG